MRKIDLGTGENWLAADDSERFVPLGRKSAPELDAGERARMVRRTDEMPEGTWATLGPWNPEVLAGFGGEVRCSRLGNSDYNRNRSGATTVRIMKAVDVIRGPGLSRREAGDIVERFIDLRGIYLDRCPRWFALDEQPSLRLTVFVRQGYGAQLFLLRSRTAKGFTELLQPEPTRGFTCSRRNRLTYRIPLWPEKGFAEPAARGHESAEQPILRCKGKRPKYETRVVIKVLVFRRKNSNSEAVMERSLAAVKKDGYQLLKWDRTHGRFKSVTSRGITLSAKTLLLLHGTGSETAKSFEPLIKEGTASWLQRLLQNGGRYNQVLALDHNTVFDSLAANERHLNSWLGGSFTEPVDVLTHSRGGLLGKHLAMNGARMEVDRAALNACANGVGYLRMVRGINLFLSMMAKIGKYDGMGGIALALAQHSPKFFLTLDGLKPMIPGSAQLKAVAAKPIPSGREPTRFLPIVGDWESKSAWYLWGIDAVLKTILGRQHDWVVGSKEQGIVAPNHGVPGFDAKPFVKSMHNRYFEKSRVPKRIEKFLLKGQ